MVDEIKFPNGGYAVKVVNKEDILKSIDINITDKEIALELIKRLEIDAFRFLNKGKWTGIPFLGNIRVPLEKQYFLKQKEDGVFKDAKELVDRQQYIMFRTNLSIENKLKAKAERYYKYVCSMAINRNRKYYKHLCTHYTDTYARLKLFFSFTVTAVDNEYEINYND